MTQKYLKPKKIADFNRSWPDRELTKAPLWSSVDLRDGNQALPEPMDPGKKLRYFQLLCRIGFREIEVSFPSSSKSDFRFVRDLIERKYIPEDVTIGVLSPVRKPLIRETAAALEGCRKAIFHLYLAVSDLHGKLVLGKSRKELLDMASEGARFTRKCLTEAGLIDRVRLEFSPEEFTDADPDFSIELCTAVREAWEAPSKESFIINLPATVERRPPWQYADMIQYFQEHFSYMDRSILSVHAHNDQGCAAADAEMGLLAGAERVEGTLFGFGERTGNTDLVVMALNMLSMGIDPGLDFSDLLFIVREVEDITGISVPERHPYAGSLVFTAFSGSHQDAIHKGLDRLKESEKLFCGGWKVPYLHIDPADIGRDYDTLIRINSQSGKGGMLYVLEHDCGICPPKAMYDDIRSAVQRYSESTGKEVRPNDLMRIFHQEFRDVKGPLELIRFSRDTHENENDDEAVVTVKIRLKFNGEDREITASGNGPISATVHAIRDEGKLYSFVVEDYSEKSMGISADARAIAFVSIRRQPDGQRFFGAGEHPNIDQAAMNALFAALNKAMNNDLEKTGIKS